MRVMGTKFELGMSIDSAAIHLRCGGCQNFENRIRSDYIVKFALHLQCSHISLSCVVICSNNIELLHNNLNALSVY